MAAVPVTPWGTVNTEGFRGAGTVLMTSIRRDASETGFGMTEGAGRAESGCFHISIFKMVGAMHSIDLETINFPSFMANRMRLPPRKPLKNYSLLTWNVSTGWDKGCSVLWSLLSLHSQSCTKRQQSKCFPFLRAYKSSPFIYSFTQ